MRKLFHLVFTVLGIKYKCLVGKMFICLLELCVVQPVRDKKAYWNEMKTALEFLLSSYIFWSSKRSSNWTLQISVIFKRLLKRGLIEQSLFLLSNCMYSCLRSWIFHWPRKRKAEHFSSCTSNNYSKLTEFVVSLDLSQEQFVIWNTFRMPGWLSLQSLLPARPVWLINSSKG